MADIGATLREARMRRRIDITDMEVETKIRAKYLRALENEEWDALPGPAYVKSFLRTYADALGLDAKRIVEEYKVRHERPSEVDLHPIRPARGGVARDRRRRRGVPGWLVVGVVLAGILASLYALGRDQGDDPVATGTTSTQERPAAGGDDARGSDAPARRRPRPIRLRLVATGDVFVCLVDAAGRERVDGATLTAGQSTGVFRSRSFRMVLGNNAVTLRIDGRDRTLPPSSEPIARRLTRQGGLRPLPAGEQPDCV